MQRSSLIRQVLVSLLGLLLTVASVDSVSAAFISPPGWSRGAVNTTYQHWDVFKAVNHPLNHPADFGLFNPAGVPNLADNGGGSVVTGSGNLYSPGAPEDIDITVPNYGLAGALSTTIILQTRTLGTEINPSTVKIGGVSPNTTQELSRASLGGQGFDVETLWRWDLPGNATQYLVEFTAVETSLSLGSAAVDTFTSVPEPGAAALIVSAGLALGVGAMYFRRRKRLGGGA